MSSKKMVLIMVSKYLNSIIALRNTWFGKRTKDDGLNEDFQQAYIKELAPFST